MTEARGWLRCVREMMFVLHLPAHIDRRTMAFLALPTSFMEVAPSAGARSAAEVLILNWITFTFESCRRFPVCFYSL